MLCPDPYASRWESSSNRDISADPQQVCRCHKIRSGWLTKGLCCHAEGPWQAEEMGWQECQEVQYRETKLCTWGRRASCINTCWRENSFAERDLGFLVDTKLNVSQKWALATKKVNGILSYIKRSLGNWSKLVILPLYSVPARPHLECCVHFWAPQYKIWTYGIEPNEWTWRWLRD